jgi:hypothetical protein
VTGALRWLRYGPRAFAAEVIIAVLGVLIVLLPGGPSCEANQSSPPVWTSLPNVWTGVALVVVGAVPTWWTLRWLVQVNRSRGSDHPMRLWTALWALVAVALWVAAALFIVALIAAIASFASWGCAPLNIGF